LSVISHKEQKRKYANDQQNFGLSDSSFVVLAIEPIKHISDSLIKYLNQNSIEIKESSLKKMTDGKISFFMNSK